MRARRLSRSGRGALVGLAASVLIGTTSAAGQTGGATAPSYDPASTPTYAPGGKAKLTKKGKAIAPANAPPAVKAAIQAGNMIRKKPYRWGGGHRSFPYDKGYDCSGAVSFVLWAAGLLESSMPSGSFMRWGSPGRGSWITVYANKGHMYAVIAGLRWDTSAVGESVRRGKGPRWRKSKRKPRGYKIRHHPSY